MSTKINTKDILDDVFTQVIDNSTVLRTKMLAWLNVVLQQVAIERKWMFLDKTSLLTAASNAILKPSDFASFVSAKQGTSWLLKKTDRLTEEQAFNMGVSTATSPVASGFTEDGTNITFHPGAVGSVTLKYQQEIPVYADNQVTIVPVQFAPLLKRACLDFYYEFDADSRLALSFQLNRTELVRVKTWDNRQKPVPKRTKQGYARGYL